jgi:thiol:disulfide interchange protein
MSDPEGAAGPGRRERLLLLALAGLLALLVVLLRGGLTSQAPLEALARRSPELGTALTDGTPTLVEFYADWCESCRAMAPAMEAIEREQRGRLDVVLLNVDNPRWQPELERYAVNGIPHLELFDAGGSNRGHAIGARSTPELEALTDALLAGEPLPELAGVGAVSRLEAGPIPTPPAAVAPRSHG